MLRTSCPQSLRLGAMFPRSLDNSTNFPGKTMLTYGSPSFLRREHDFGSVRYLDQYKWLHLQFFTNVKMPNFQRKYVDGRRRLLWCDHPCSVHTYTVLNFQIALHIFFGQCSQDLWTIARSFLVKTRSHILCDARISSKTSRPKLLDLGGPRCWPIYTLHGQMTN
jgi:hypothetical protein